MEEKLAGVWDHDLNNVVVSSCLRVLAVLAFIFVVLEVCNSHKAALSTSMNSVKVTHVAKSFLEELGGTLVRGLYRGKSCSLAPSLRI